MDELYAISTTTITSILKLSLETNARLEMSKPSTMSRLIPIWILIITALAGCSSTSLVYNNADWLIRSKIDDYFPLSGRQQRQLKRDIKTFFEWHRQQELVEYSDVLTQFNQQFADGLTLQELDLFLDKLSAARVRFAKASLQSASLFLSTVTIEQIDYFDQDFTEKQTEKAESLNLSSQEYMDESYINFVDKLEDWFGDFDDSQLTRLRAISDIRPDKRQYWFDQSELRHQRFSILLRRKPGREEIEQYLLNRFIVLNQDDEQARDIRLQGQTYWRNAMLGIDKIITTRQRKKMIREIADYASDFAALSKQSNKPFRSNLEK